MIVWPFQKKKTLEPKSLKSLIVFPYAELTIDSKEPEIHFSPRYLKVFRTGQIYFKKPTILN